MNKIFALSIVISLLCHIGVVISAITPQEPISTSVTAPENRMAIKLLPPEQLATIRPAFLKSDEYYKPTHHPYSKEGICEGKDKNYIGIGMMIQPGTRLVINVPEMYPAYRAGIRVNDVIVDPYGPVIDRAGYIEFGVERDNVISRVRIKAEKICYTG